MTPGIRYHMGSRYLGFLKIPISSVNDVGILIQATFGPPGFLFWSSIGNVVRTSSINSAPVGLATHRSSTTVPSSEAGADVWEAILAIR